MSESGSFDPGEWKRPEHNDFRAARRKYDKDADRSYASNSDPKIDFVPNSLITEFESPLVFALDDTFSMGDYPGIVFGKAPYFDVEGKSYLGQNRGISFALINDVSSDKNGLLVRPFVNGLDIKKRLAEFPHERNGGPGYRESYEMCALYYARNVSMPKAKEKPIFIFVGDEAPYDFVEKDAAKKYAKVNLEAKIETKDIMEELKKKFSVYMIRKPYGNALSDFPVENKIIQSQWESYLGADHIAILSEPERILDVTFGILANEKKKIDYFKEEIEQRQIESVKENERAAGIAKVKAAYAALAPVFGKKLKISDKWKTN